MQATAGSEEKETRLGCVFVTARVKNQAVMIQCRVHQELKKINTFELHLCNNPMKNNRGKKLGAKMGRS